MSTWKRLIVTFQGQRSSTTTTTSWAPTTATNPMSPTCGRSTGSWKRWNSASGARARCHELYLYGQSWGGILAMEYALKYQKHLKGLIISNMMASIPAYNVYADAKLKPAMDPAVLAEVERIEAAEDYENPRYMELLIPHHYEEHILRMPYATWPDPVNRAFTHVNPSIYVPMQGPSELGASGKLLAWDRTADLPNLFVPTDHQGSLRHDGSNAHMEWMADPSAAWTVPPLPQEPPDDDPEPYFEGIIRFINDVDAARFLTAGSDRGSDRRF